MDNSIDLPSSEELILARRRAEKRMEQFSTEDWQQLRNRAKNDLFFLNVGVLGYKKLSENLHGHVCSWAHGTDDEQFRELLLPRGHYKSTVFTIGDSIRIVLPDDMGNCVWPRNLGTNCRLLIGHEVHDSAARFLFSITRHFLQNPILMGLFPECIPDPKKHRINKYELELPRDDVWSEPTFDTIGVGAKAQGRHYNYLKLDDLFGADARDSATIRKTTYDWFDNIQSLFSTFSQDHFDLIGTRWAFDDLYAHAHEMYGDTLIKYIRGAEERNAHGERVTIFPEEFPLDKLKVLKKNKKVYSAQYANDPKEGASEFEDSWLRYYHWTGPNHVGVFGSGERINVRSDTDNIIFVDPAINGLGGFIVTAVDYKNRIFCVDAQKKVWSPPEMVELIFKSVQRWQPRLVVIEAVNFSVVFQHWIEAEMRTRGVRFKIEPGKTKSKEKPKRVKGLENYFSAGQIFFNEGQTDLIEEFQQFGATEDYHILDALAYGPEYWRKGARREAIESGVSAAQDLMVGRDATTGYSKY